MQRHGRQSPSLASPWPPPPRRASTALDLTSDIHGLSTTGPYSYVPESASRSGVPTGLSSGEIASTQIQPQPLPSVSKSNASNVVAPNVVAPNVVAPGSESDTYRERVNQVVQNFYLKAAMIIIQQRIPVPPLFASRTNSKKVNKWFNLDLDDTDAFRDELSLWKHANVFQESIPPLVIETFIDTHDLTANQSLVILDSNQKRWNVEQAINNLVGSNPQSRRTGGRLDDGRPDIILERWIIELKERKGAVEVPDLPIAYKHGVILFRTLYTYAGLLPAQRLLRKLAKSKGSHGNLKVCCRIANSHFPSDGRDGLGIALIDNESSVIDTYSFGAVDTPAGEVHISVSYRKQCDFRVDDSEALLSSHFINLDEHYFQPSLHGHRGIPSHQHTRNQSDLDSSVPVSAVSSHTRMNLDAGTRTNALQLVESGGSNPSGLTRIHQSSLLPGTSPGQSTDVQNRPVYTVGSVPRSGDQSDISRRPSVSFMQPFKSPSLSNSPSDVLSSSPRTSVTRISSTNTAPIQARTRSAVSPIVSKSSLSYDTPPPLGTSASPRPPSIGRYSSSFGPRRSRPTFSNDDNSSGRASYSSSMVAPGSTLFPDPPPPTNTSLPSDDQKVADFLKLLDEKQPVKLFNHGDSSNKTYSALNKFQRMKESYNVLSESMTNSVSLNRSHPTSGTQSPSPHHTINQSYSPSTSPGKPHSPFSPHTPTIPSRLSAGHTADNSPIDRVRLRSSFGATRESIRGHVESSDVRTTMTSPLDIPSSPRPFRNHGPDSFTQQRHRKFDGSFIVDSSTYSPQHDISGSLESSQLSLEKLSELRQATEEVFPGSRQAQISAGSSSNHVLSGQNLGFTNPHKAHDPRPKPGTRGVARSSAPSPGIQGDRPSFSMRHPSYSRSGFTEEEDLLFAMSDMMSRRSIDQDQPSTFRTDHSRQGNH